MPNIAAALKAADKLLEALADSERERLTELISEEIEALLGPWWDGQGVAFSDEFVEALSGLVVIAEDDWLWIWDQVARENADEMSEALLALIETAMETGGAVTALQFGVSGSFDLGWPAAVQYLEDRGASLVTGLNETSQGVIRKIVVDGMGNGDSVEAMAKAIIERFGEFSEIKPQGHIRNRAELVAATEVGNAYEEASYLIGQDLRAVGVDLEKFWANVGDDKVSEGCLENTEDDWITFDDEFNSGDLRPLRFPGCRCGLRMRRKRSE